MLAPEAGLRLIRRLPVARTTVSRCGAYNSRAKSLGLHTSNRRSSRKIHLYRTHAKFKPKKHHLLLFSFFICIVSGPRILPPSPQIQRDQGHNEKHREYGNQNLLHRPILPPPPKATPRGQLNPTESNQQQGMFYYTATIVNRIKALRIAKP